jgi:hypothetical protein
MLRKQKKIFLQVIARLKKSVGKNMKWKYEFMQK